MATLVFTAHQMMLLDAPFGGAICKLVEEGENPPEAVVAVAHPAVTPGMVPAMPAKVCSQVVRGPVRRWQAAARRAEAAARWPLRWPRPSVLT